MVTLVSMLIIVPDHRLHVVVGVLCDPSNKYLVQQRMENKSCAGYWEFPGGKVEQGESSEIALQRELLEELNIISTKISSLINIPVDYNHAKVFLEVFLVQQFSGIPQSNESQVFVWKSKKDIGNMHVLKAVYPILDALS